MAKKTVYLSPLKPGDLVDIVAPGSKCGMEDLHRAQKVLESWGLRVRMPKSLFGKGPFTSNTDEKRWEFLHRALFAKDSKAIWCVRGGYGSIRLVPYLNKIKAPPAAKWFLGHSDITTLHLYFAMNWNWPVYHSPLFNRLGQAGLKMQEVRDLKNILLKGERTIEFPKLIPMNAAARRRRVVRGRVQGGNLRVIESTLGTSQHMPSSKSILFLEEIGERGYRIDRSFEQFRQAGVLENTQAVVFGDFTDCNEVDGRELWKVAIADFAKSVSFPVFRGLPAGHDEVRRVVPLNTDSELHCGAKGTLICETGVRPL